jgi:hypothetical protein
LESVFAEPVEFWSNVVVILAFIFAGITFIITYYKNNKDHQIKIAYDLSTQLFESENNLIKYLNELKNDPDIISLTQWYPQKIQEDIKPYVIQHLNNWEWFSLLVNDGSLSNSTLKKHFKDNFIFDYEKMLPKYPDLMFPQTRILYDKWTKENNN